MLQSSPQSYTKSLWGNVTIPARVAFVISFLLLLSFIDVAGDNLRRFSSPRSRDDRKNVLSTLSTALLERDVLKATRASPLQSVVNTSSSTEILLSAGRPATSSVRGNLGPPSVVTSEVMNDWLADRWQAAADMSGTPLPGEHWVEIDLEHIASKLTRVVLDWEDAYSSEWTLRARLYEDAGWATLAVASDARQLHVTEKHVVQEVTLPASSARYVRLIIHKPSTRWGSSLWRFQIWGIDA